MRISLDSTLFFLAFAHALAAPASANGDNEPKRHLLSRASHGFRRSALRHSAGLARDLRVALRGLGTAETAHHGSVLARSNHVRKPYCVYNDGNRQPNSSTGSDTHRPPSSTFNPTASPSATTSSTSSPGQSKFRLAQSYSGQSFFNGWDFFTGSDPTNGLVHFVDQQTAVRVVLHLVPRVHSDDLLS